MLYHVVLLALKDTERHELDSLVADLRALSRLPMVIRLAAGAALTEATFDIALVVELAGSDALADYRAHPDHQPVLARIASICRSVQAVDFTP